MNPSSSSSLSCPPVYKSNSRPQSSTNREIPSIIPLDYNYQIMAPSSIRPHTSRYNLVSRASAHQSNTDVDVDMDEDLPYSSLFGDPVPPPPPDNFLTTTFEPSHYLRSTSVELTSEEEQTLGQTMTLSSSSVPQRLFPQVPYTTLMGRRFSNSSSQRNFEIMPTNIPKLKPPDIQILPNSSGGSSSDHQSSPNYILLNSQDIPRKSKTYDNNEESEDISELKETYTISGAQSVREFMQTTTRKSSTGQDTTVDMNALSPPQNFESSFPRQFSNESYSSDEWFRNVNSDYPEFNKMPKLRPSSKNVMSIKRDEMPMRSPVAAIINDSNGSSCSEDRVMENTRILDKPTVCLESLKLPERPPSPSPSCLRSLEETTVSSPRAYIKQRRKSIYPTQLVTPTTPDEEDKPPPIPPKPHLIDENDLVKAQPQTPLKREVTPVIMKDSITTGGDYRVDQSRLHKKSSFTIISDKSAQSSRTQSPKIRRTREHTSASLIPTKQMTLHENRLQKKSLSSTQLKLPQLVPPSLHPLTADDSPRLSVQFDMTGRHSPSKLPPQKGILQHKPSMSSSQDALPNQHMRRRSSILPQVVEATTRPQIKSCEALPMITDPYRTSIPRLHRSTLDLSPESAVFPPGALPRPLKPNPNPTRKQKGLLKILNHEETLMRLPLKSNWSSMDDLWLERKRKHELLPIHNGKASRRRSSSTSPSRRSSTQTVSDRRSSNLSSLTTSDFSFRRPSITTKPKTPQNQRRKSVFQLPSPAARRKSSSTSSISTAQIRQSRTKIAKPTTLSPIIGTPNKDSSSALGPLHVVRPTGPSSDSISDSNSRRDSLSKIPIRSQASSRSNSRMSTHGGSRAASRTGSPNKDYSAIGVHSRAASPSKGYNNREGRRSQLAASDEVYSRITSPMREYLETGGRLSQMGIKSGVYSRTGSPIKDYKETGVRSSEVASGSGLHSRTESPLKDYQEMVRRSGTGSTMKSYPDTADGRSSRIPTSRSGSRASQYLNSQTNSRAQSRANSRTHSRSTSRASTRPISLPGSRPTSRLDQAKDVANSRSNSRLSIHSNKKLGSTSPTAGRKTPTKARRKSVSLSPISKRSGMPRRGSLSPVGKKAKGVRSRSRSKARSSPDRIARSHIPVSHTNGRSSTRSPPSKRKSNVATGLRKTSSLKAKAKTPTKQPASAKKVPTSIRKPEASVKRTPSSVGKQGAVTKQYTSAIQKPTTSKKEASNTSKNPTINAKPLSKEATSLLVLKKALNKKASVLRKKNEKETQPEKTSQGKDIKHGGETKEAANDLTTSGSKNQMDDKDVVVDKKTEEKAHGSTAASVAVPPLTTLKRQPSTVSLMRVSSKISLLKKRSDSNISKKTLDILVPDVETTEGKAPSPTQQLVEMALAEGGSIPAAIIEKSQKTLENIQKTVTEATEEIQKTINENLTDLKSLEQDMGLTSDSAGSPTPSVTTVVEKKSSFTKQTGKSASRQGTAEDTGGKIPSKSPLPPTHPIEAAVSVVSPAETHELAMTNGSSKHDAATAAGASERVSERAISVLPEVDSESANLQSYQSDARKNVDDKLLSAMKSNTSDINQTAMKDVANAADEYGTEAKRRSPDGQGGSQAGSGKGSGSQEYLENKSLSDEDDTTSKGCCRCCAKFCMPCRRLRCSRCCQRKKSLSQDEAEQPVLSATSSATTTHLEIVNEKQAQKTSCWQKLNCCKSCRKSSKDLVDSSATLRQAEVLKETSFRPMGPPKQSKCGLCLSKVFCCRSVNKIDPKTGDETEVKKCCFCIPCRKKQGMTHGSTVTSVAGGSTAAWEDPESDITATDAAEIEAQNLEAKPGCCRRFCNILLCCRKKKVAVTDSRRPSIKAPPPEDNRRKLHADLIEYSSKMKGAIPVLPLWLAWFCVICNAVVPGLGTLLSGLFCLCVGIPRFSQYDSAKARLGSFIINTIVAVSQLFCVLFCFVGWGWSIWWGTIMLKCARKLSKIRKVERLEIEEEKRQAAAAEAAAALAAKTAQGGSEPEVAKS